MSLNLKFNQPNIEDAINWLTQNKYQFSQITRASEDASFRKYFRLHQVKKNEINLNKSLILLISPPDKEKNQEFVNIAQRLGQINMSSVEVLKHQQSKGYLLLNDLGELNLFDYYQKDNFQTDTLDYYFKALEILAVFNQNNSQLTGGLKFFNQKEIERELNLFNDWFINQTLSGFNTSLIKDWQVIQSKIFPLITKNFLKQPIGFTHRDFHSKNLMIRPLSNQDKNISVIDFQDALIAPIIYDLVCLLKDSYIQLPETILNILNQKAFEIYQPYFNDYDQFRQSMLWVGMQRQIKVIAIFCRLNLRDGKKNYLKSIPLTLHYLSESSKQIPEMVNFHHFIQDKIIPLWFEYSIQNNLTL